jgi:hypothetical protein
MKRSELDFSEVGQRSARMRPARCSWFDNTSLPQSPPKKNFTRNTNMGLRASGVQSRTIKFRADGFELRSGADK